MTLIQEIGEYGSLDEAKAKIVFCKRADHRDGRKARYYIRFRLVRFSE